MSYKYNVLVIGRNGNLSSSIYKLATSELYHNFDCTFLGSNDLNLMDLSSIKPKLSEYQPDIILNCAAYNFVDKADLLNNWEAPKLINWHAVKEIAEYANDNNIFLVHFSSDYVFYGDKTSAYIETDYATTKNMYGFGKALGEGEIRKIMENFLIIRLSWLFNHEQNNFYTKITRKLLEEEKVSVTNDKFGTPTYVYEVAQALPKILNRVMLQRSLCGVYHFSNNEVVSWYEFAQKIKHHLETQGNQVLCKKLIPISVEQTEYVALRPDYSALCSDLIQDKFNFKISSLDQAIENCTKEYLHLHRL